MSDPEHWRDPDDYPEVSSEQFDRAVLKFAGKIVTRPFDPAKHFAADAAQIGLLTDAFATGDPDYIAAALSTVSRARGLA